MKQILLKIAARFGLVSAHRLAALRDEVKELQRAAKISQKKNAELTAQAQKAQGELKRHLELLKQARADVERLQQREEEFTRISGQLTEAERALALAREQLTAVEVKLDILEGAANILDARTRTAPSLQQQAGKSGAAV